MPFYQVVAGHLDLDEPFIIESKLAKNTGNPKVAYFRRRMRGGTDDNDLWMKTFGMSQTLLSLVYAQNNTAWCSCGRCNVKKGRWQKQFIFPSNAVRLLMVNLKEDENISADDIVGLLTHFSVSRAIKDYVAEGMLYHYLQLVIKKRKVNQIIIHMFKSSIVAPLGSHSIMSSKGRTWRPLNALRTSKCCWDSLMGPSCLVSSSAEDKFVLDCANSFMDCELLSREDFGLVALSAIVPVVGPSRRSLGQATTPTTFFSPDRRDTLSVEVTPIQDRQSRLPPMPSVFLAEDLAMPIAAIIELVCSIGDDGGSDMEIDELGLTLRREVDMAFFGISPKNPLNQKTVTTADLGALARRL